MFKYLLTKQVFGGSAYGIVQVVGTFDSIAAVNKYIETSSDYPEGIKFISCRQIIERTDDRGIKIKLDLTSVPHNPVNRINELKELFEEEPTILDFQHKADIQKDFYDYKRTGYSTHIYPSKDYLSLQFWGWAIVLNEDGTWFWEATDGG